VQFDISKESFLKAEEFARRALDLDDSLAEAHATLGSVLETYYYDQSAAEKEFRQALQLNPNYGKVCNSYGVFLARMGRLHEAVAEILKTQELNPLALDVNGCAAVIFNCANQFEKSREACERMLRVDKDFFLPTGTLRKPILRSPSTKMQSKCSKKPCCSQTERQ
jgi:Tfp pilus assembly protein PilF